MVELAPHRSKEAFIFVRLPFLSGDHKERNRDLGPVEIARTGSKAQGTRKQCPPKATQPKLPQNHEDPTLGLTVVSTGL